MLTNICVNTLTGLPASGKSTFCQKIQREAQTFNVIHICYDDFIRLPTTDDSPAQSHYFQSKQYKKHRFSLLWLIQQLIDDIKQNTDFSKFQLAILTDFPHVKLNVTFESSKKLYLLLIDDTMHYKSMRKEVRTLARDNELGYFVTYFHSTLDGAIERNRGRTFTVDENHLKRMHAIIEGPTDEDGQIIRVNVDDDEEIATNFVESFALDCIKTPLKSLQLVSEPVVEQTIIHKVDLVLRQCVHRKMRLCKETNRTGDLRKIAEALCAKRSFVLREIKLGRIDLPDNLDDLSNLID
ncbi:uncharacterized protein LOC119076537 [Bradysia coprophila]|uniref:uncharacterized protein LOC119076537 n=1 Tax=Bradysia coprophila TaxID=38358 RepID=UPI00187D9D69|nr:uncharacterized protein LOC119076537 [Bradysia coprophila]